MSTSTLIGKVVGYFRGDTVSEWGNSIHKYKIDSTKLVWYYLHPKLWTWQDQLMPPWPFPPPPHTGWAPSRGPTPPPPPGCPEARWCRGWWRMSGSPRHSWRWPPRHTDTKHRPDIWALHDEYLPHTYDTTGLGNWGLGTRAWQQGKLEKKMKNVFAHRMTLSPIKVLNVNQTQEEYESHSWSTLLGSVMKRIRELTRIPSANIRTVPITRLHIWASQSFYLDDHCLFLRIYWKA